MGRLSLSAVEEIEAPPAVVFGLFGVGAGAGWVFDALCDRIAVGAAVTLRAPFDGPGAAAPDIHGRICLVRFGRRIDIAHEQPWRGRVTIRFEPTGTGTRVRLTASLDELGLEWLMRRRGFTLPPSSTTSVRLGLLTSKSGPGSLFAAATDSLATLAVDESNWWSATTPRIPRPASRRRGASFGQAAAPSSSPRRRRPSLRWREPLRAPRSCSSSRS